MVTRTDSTITTAQTAKRPRVETDETVLKIQNYILPVGIRKLPTDIRELPKRAVFVQQDTSPYLGEFVVSRLGLATVEEYRLFDSQEEAKAKEAGRPFFPQLSPLIESKITEAIPVPGVVLGENQEENLHQILEAVLAAYKQKIEDLKISSGPFGGNILTVTVTFLAGTAYPTITQVGYKAYPKPAITTDVGIVVEGRKEGTPSFYFVGITRKNPPGKDRGAFAGGFNNKLQESGKVSHFDTPMETLKQEALEEMHLFFGFSPEQIEEMKYNYNILKMSTTAHVGLQERRARGSELSTHDYSYAFPCDITYLGQYASSDAPLAFGGELLVANPDHPDYGAKRADMTHLFRAWIDASKKEGGLESIEEVKSLFKAGDDAAAIEVIDITEAVTASKDKTHAAHLATDIFERFSWGILHHKNLLAEILYHTANDVKHLTQDI